MLHVSKFVVLKFHHIFELRRKKCNKKQTEKEITETEKENKKAARQKQTNQGIDYVKGKQKCMRT